MVNRNDNRTWDEVIRSGGLTPSIDSISKYNEQFALNQIKVDAYLDYCNSTYLTTSDIIEVHKLSFDGITDYGGKLSKTQLMFGPHMGSPPETMAKELQLLDQQMAELWENAKTPEAKLDALSFQHVRLVGIHPFTDGNGRTARKTLEFGMEKVFGTTIKNVVQRSDYILANNSAILHNNIGRLSRVIAANYGLLLKGRDYKTAGYYTRAEQKVELRKHNSDVVNLKNSKRETGEKRWFTPVDVNLMVQNVNGKPTKAFNEKYNRLQLDLSQPLTFAKTVEAILKFKESGAIKSKLFGTLNTKAYTEAILYKSQPIVEFSSHSEKENFEHVLRNQINGKSTSEQTTEFIDNLTPGVLAVKQRKQIMTMEDYKQTEAINTLFNTTLIKDYSQDDILVVQGNNQSQQQSHSNSFKYN